MVGYLSPKPMKMTEMEHSGASPCSDVAAVVEASEKSQLFTILWQLEET